MCIRDRIKVPGFDFSFAALLVGLFLAGLSLRFLFMMLGIGIGARDFSLFKHSSGKEGKSK